MLCVHCETLLGNLWVELEIVGNEFVIYHVRGAALFVIRRNNNRGCKNRNSVSTTQGAFAKIYVYGLKLDSCNVKHYT